MKTLKISIILIILTLLSGIATAGRRALSAEETADSRDTGVKTSDIELVETILSSLHEGNIARYRLRLASFRKWLEAWR